MTQTQTNLTTIKATISGALGAMASTSFVATDKTAFEGEMGPYLKARISFQGPGIGTVSLITPLLTAPELAARVRGLEPDDPEAAVRASETVGSVLNVLCDQLVSERFGTSGPLHLSIPDLDTIADCRLPLSREDAFTCLLDDVPVLVLSEGLQ